MVGAAIGSVMLYAQPEYENFPEYDEKATRLEDALSTAEELRVKRDELQQRLNSFTEDDYMRLEKVLPSNVDNVQLSIDITEIARSLGLVLNDVQVDIEDASSLVTDEVVDPLGTVSLSIGVSGTYPQVVRFVQQMEKSLRIMDIETLSFSAPAPTQVEVGSGNTKQKVSQYTGSEVYDVDMKFVTYWLRPL
jgi:Tfp pilus assembly protein PilO